MWTKKIQKFKFSILRWFLIGIVTGLIIFFIIQFMILFFNILNVTFQNQMQNWELAKASMRGSCGLFTEEDKQKYISGGSVIENSSGIFVKIINNNKKVLKHEAIHMKQIQRYPDIFFSCDLKFIKILIEYEAYLGDELPDNIYLKLYGNWTEILNYTK